MYYYVPILVAFIYQSLVHFSSFIKNFGTWLTFFLYTLSPALKGGFRFYVDDPFLTIASQFLDHIIYCPLLFTSFQIASLAKNLVIFINAQESLMYACNFLITTSSPFSLLFKYSHYYSSSESLIHLSIVSLTSSFSFFTSLDYMVPKIHCSFVYLTHLSDKNLIDKLNYLLSQCFQLRAKYC